MYKKPNIAFIFVKRVVFPNNTQKGQLQPPEKEEQFSTELKKQLKRRRKRTVAEKSTGNSRGTKTWEQKILCKKNFSNEQMQLQ